MNQISQSEFRFTGKHMLLVMISFFGVIITVNFTMATLATKSWTGLVVKNTYVASQQFNEHLEKAAVVRSAGFQSDLGYANGELTFSLKDRNGAAILIEGLQAEIGRPSFEQADQTHNLKHTGGKQYLAKVPLAVGIWSLSLTGVADGIAYRRDARLFVSAEGEGCFE